MSGGIANIEETADEMINDYIKQTGATVSAPARQFISGFMIFCNTMKEMGARHAQSNLPPISHTKIRATIEAEMSPNDPQTAELADSLAEIAYSYYEEGFSSK